jgi:glycerol kinase
MRESTALGAAIAAGFAVDVWETIDDLEAIKQADRTTFEPAISPEQSNAMFERWNRAVKMSRGWDKSCPEDDQ